MCALKACFLRFILFQQLLKLWQRQPSTLLLLRLLRRWSTCAQEITQVFRRRETGVVVWPAIDNLPFLRHVLAPGAERVLDRAKRSVKQRAHLVAFVAYEFSEEIAEMKL